MGSVLAIGPIAGQLYGAGKLHGVRRRDAAGDVAGLALAVPGCLLLLVPDPFLALARADPGVARRCATTWAASPSRCRRRCVFTAYRGFNVAVSRPKAVMAMQVGALALKVPVNAVLVFGIAWPTPLGEIRVPALGAAGCGLATAIVMWCQLAARLRRPAQRSVLSPLRARPRRAHRAGRARRAWARCFASACRWASRCWSR